ncbi:mannitol 1-phosphate dehydrogenase 2 [Xylaria nigripes]|nr:mannitol 1-phosphate dehydrogenase 2 [Xylaria nigripes]
MDPDCIVYESAAQFSAIGAGIGFGPNVVCVTSLVSLPVPQVYYACRTRQWDGRRNVWVCVRIGDRPGGNILADANDVLLHFADGTTAKHTGTLGSDGIKSQMQKFLLGSAERNAGEAGNSQIYFRYHGLIFTFSSEKRKTVNDTYLLLEWSASLADLLTLVIAFPSRDKWASPEWVVCESTATSIFSVIERPDVWALFDHSPAPTDRGAQWRVRSARTQKAVKTSWEAGQLRDFELKGDGIDVLERSMRIRMPWIWSIDLRAELDRTRAIFR